MPTCGLEKSSSSKSLELFHRLVTEKCAIIATSNPIWPQHQPRSKMHVISINHNSPDPMPKNTQLLDHDAFTALVAKATRKAGIPVERSEGLALFITHQGQSMRCNLTTAYQAYRQSPTGSTMWCRRTWLPWPRCLPRRSCLPQRLLRRQFMPLLNQSGRLQSLQSAELPAPYHRPSPAA